jgi:cell division protein FtsB
VPYNDIAPISRQMTILAGLMVVGFMAFGLALSYYKNILFDHQLTVMEERNATLREHIQQGQQELQYLESAQYKDKYAKENFSLIRPGEHIVFLPEEDNAPSAALERGQMTKEEKKAVLAENLRLIPAIDHWEMYLFRRDALEQFAESKIGE